MKQWLIIYSSGQQEILEAEDLDDIYRKTDRDVVAAIRLDIELRCSNLK